MRQRREHAAHCTPPSYPLANTFMYTVYNLLSAPTSPDCLKYTALPRNVRDFVPEAEGAFTVKRTGSIFVM